MTTTLQCPSVTQFVVGPTTGNRYVPNGSGTVSVADTDALGLIALGFTSAPPGIGSPIVDASTARTFALADAFAYIKFTNGSPVTATVPPNSDVPFQVGTKITIEQTGAGAVTVAAGAGVTVNAHSLTMPNQFAVMALTKVDADTWTFYGA